MEYRRLGNSGLVVSALGLGCMSFGEPTRGMQPWSLDEEASRPIIKAALEAGITFIDTANVYSAGSSEEIVGRALKDYANRDDIVLASKVHFPMRPGPNGGGQSRKAIMTEVEHSLRRLGTDYLDLYQIHRFDPNTPIEETLQALDDLVRSGKVRYLGASSMYAWQFAKMLFTSDAHGWSRFISMQGHYNLIQREEEREMAGLCLDQGVGRIPWSPLARGRIMRGWDEQTARSENDAVGIKMYPRRDGDDVIVQRVAEVSDRLGVTRAQVALAWVLQQPGVSSPIVGVTRIEQLHDLVGAVDIRLDDAALAYLAEPYEPHPTPGF